MGLPFAKEEERFLLAKIARRGSGLAAPACAGRLEMTRKTGFAIEGGHSWSHLSAGEAVAGGFFE
jgi:hypothetical protein